MRKLFVSAGVLAAAIVLGLVTYAHADTWFVGIGTDTPLVPLHIAQDDVNIGSKNGQFMIGPSTTQTEGLTIGYASDRHLAWMQSGNYGTDPYRNLTLQPNEGKVGITTLTPTSRLTVNDGDLEVTVAPDWYYQYQGGIVLHAPDGHCARTKLGDDNSLVVTTITCP